MRHRSAALTLTTGERLASQAARRPADAAELASDRHTDRAASGRSAPSGRRALRYPGGGPYSDACRRIGIDTGIGIGVSTDLCIGIGFCIGIGIGIVWMRRPRHARCGPLPDH
jgi:hypothetical protein